MTKSAVFSPCRTYRYQLWRIWDDKLYCPECKQEWDLDVCARCEGSPTKKPYCVFICLNPSTADEVEDDPTIRRCINFAKSWGYGGLCMLNVFAYRATLPEVMKAQGEKAVGPDNKDHILSVAKDAGIVIAGWGTHGRFLCRGSIVRVWLKAQGVKLHYLKLTSDGSPNQPLYLKSDLQPIPWI